MISLAYSQTVLKKVHIGGGGEQKAWERKREREKGIQREGREEKGREHDKQMG